ncbi:acylphosphatase-1 [Crotalus adamanteus]|uniref:Acylphosphatase-1 n=1 Tax=Crotalus adamanteus TaxID=8729 RepID=A0AAW1C524_CROAD
MILHCNGTRTAGSKFDKTQGRGNRRTRCRCFNLNSRTYQSSLPAGSRHTTAEHATPRRARLPVFSYLWPPDLRAAWPLVRRSRPVGSRGRVSLDSHLRSWQRNLRVAERNLIRQAPPTMAEGQGLVSVDYEVFGKVQGVFFRKHTQAQGKNHLEAKRSSLNLAERTFTEKAGGMHNSYNDQMLAWRSTNQFALWSSN